MIISALYNDARSKKELWLEFADKHGCQFQHIYTRSKDVSIIKMDYLFKDVEIHFEESDAKPLVCCFEINIDSKIKLIVSPCNIFDKLFSIFKKKHENQTNLFFKKYKAKSNNDKILNSLFHNSELLNLMKNSQFFELYCYSSGEIMKGRLSSTYFVDSYKELFDIYTIANNIVKLVIDNQSRN